MAAVEALVFLVRRGAGQAQLLFQGGGVLEELALVPYPFGHPLGSRLRARLVGEEQGLAFGQGIPLLGGGVAPLFQTQSV